MSVTTVTCKQAQGIVSVSKDAIFKNNEKLFEQFVTEYKKDQITVFLHNKQSHGQYERINTHYGKLLAFRDDEVSFSEKKEDSNISIFQCIILPVVIPDMEADKMFELASFKSHEIMNCPDALLVTGLVNEMLSWQFLDCSAGKRMLLQMLTFDKDKHALNLIKRVSKHPQYDVEALTFSISCVPFRSDIIKAVCIIYRTLTSLHVTYGFLNLFNGVKYNKAAFRERSKNETQSKKQVEVEL